MQRVLVFLFILVHFNLKGQNNTIYPDNFSTYFNNLYLSDPSFVPATGNFNFSFSDKSKRIASDISTINFHLEKIWREPNNSAHVIRGIALNEKEGPYISYPRFYLNYARKQQLGKDVALAAGFSFGLAGINFSTPSGSGSAKALDGGLGLGLHYKAISIGFSSMQIFNSAARALSLPVVLKRYYNIHLEAEKRITGNLHLKLYTIWRHYTTMKDQWNIGSGLTYQKFAGAGAMYQYGRGTTFFGTVQFFPDVNPVYISFAYSTALLSNIKSYNDYYELSLKYTITSVLKKN